MQGTTEGENPKNKSQVSVYLKYLPKDPQQRAQLKQAIQNGLNRLKKLHNKKPDPQIEAQIKTLQLRLLLIDSCSQMSLLRLDHLQWVFKHYCTHIFKTGKHMTFERLEYEKVHLTMERFFLFLRDFQLTMMSVGDKKQQVVDKNTIILHFKKISSNSRDLSFEQFIRCLQKIGIMYYDQKQIFYKKRQKLKQQKEKRKQDYEKRKMQRMKKKQLEGDKKRDQNEEEEEQDGIEKVNKQQMQQKKMVEEENDQFIKDMLKNKQIEDPNEQINKITNRYALEQENLETEGQKNIVNFSEMGDDTLLLLTQEEKIQYYYKFMIRVDSVKDYRDKLTQLNLPIFNKGKSKSKPLNNSEQKKVKTSEDEQVRIEQLKKRMDEKKLKQKAAPIPKPKDDGAWIKAQEQKKKKKQLKKERELNAKEKSKQETDALIQKKLDSQKSVKQKKPEYNEKQIDWNTLGKMSIDQLKLNKFNPNRYFTKDDDDKIFLDEYEGGRQRVSSGMESARERNSLTVVQDVKKRVGEVEKKQKRIEKDLEKKIGQNVPIKNRF